jgi:dTDP-3-amino-3,4,6-trideoxy-alpha-D-glucose transaminase
MFDAAAQYRELRAEIDAAVGRVLGGERYILGPEVEAFEAEFARYCGTAHAVGVGNGTEAIALSLLACGVGPGDEVLTAPNTSPFTALAITMTGARPAFVDVDARTHTLDPSRVEAALTERVRAIIPVHLYGQPAAMGPILELARARGISVIEDACQAHGARYEGRPVGSLGDMAAFSFYPTKNLGAVGDGGAVVTSDGPLAERVRMLRDGGRVDRDRHAVRGINSRLDELQAAILRVKLGHLDAWNDHRRKLAALYRRGLASADVALPLEAPYAHHVYHLFVIQSPERDALRRRLATNGIDSLVHYPIPLHEQEAFRDLGYVRGTFPRAEHGSASVLSLPLFPQLTDAQVERVCHVVVEA